ncbi:MAG: hypothetical protein H0T54_05250 [Geodermatophilaceae bacterium]|nr:hypothetical protein [Geodermatophilaceae bacterium]
MQDFGEDSSRPRASALEDVIGSSPDRLDSFLQWIPVSFSRLALLSVALVSALAGLVIGHLSAPHEPATVAAPAASADPQSESARAPALLTLPELAAIGEQASGGTYTRGSASAVPDPCNHPGPGDTGVSYVPGPRGATAVSFRVAGASVSERVSTFNDVLDARSRLREVVATAGDCQVDAQDQVVLGEVEVEVGLGDEYVRGRVVHSYPSGASSTVSVLLVRVDRALLEFSLTGPSAAAAGSGERCLTIALVALSG